jgi:hypothetical protein
VQGSTDETKQSIARNKRLTNATGGAYRTRRCLRINCKDFGMRKNEIGAWLDRTGTRSSVECVLEVIDCVCL